MPIYGYGTIGAPWSLAKDVLPKNYYKLRDIFKKARKTFQYHNSDLFIKNIEICSEYNGNIIGTYDSSKLGIEASQYQLMLESLVLEANRILGESKNEKLAKYKFDIVGNWTIGKIVIMEKK